MDPYLYLLENGVILQANNSLQIELASRPTTFITIEIIRAADSILPGGTFTADSTTVTTGSSTLTWTSSHATSCTMAPDIGSVALSGSMTITPTQTTEYTLTMVGPGGTSTNQVTINVIPATPPPVISLSTNDDVITPGASTTLSWSSEYADMLTIEPGLGTVAPTGSILISPEATTTYIATATGPGGTSSDQVVVTVMYPEPIAALSAAPSAITSGESSTLTWSTQYAQTCTIEPNIGIVVPCAGELTVTPAEETTYILTAGGQGGTTTAQVNVTVMTTDDILSLTITSPSDGDSISRPDVMVTGTIHHRDGLETGVMVNGVTALVYDGQFVANHVPLIDGENTITVKAVDVNGEYVEKALAVTVESFIRYVELQMDIESSLVPFEATLKLDTNFTSPAQPEFSFVGPGEVEFIPGVEPATWTVSITEQGVYLFSVEQYDENGASYRDQVAVLVYDRNTLDALLQAKWGEMKQSLFLNQIDNAVAFFLEGSQAIYKNQFEFIANAGVLSQVVNNMGAFRLVEHDGYGIIYDLRTIKDGEEYSFQILFVQDKDGIWRIKNY